MDTVLKVGATGNKVKDIQYKLNIIGYSSGIVDGVFGSNTKSAIIKFQKDFGLIGDGIVGKDTYNALDKIKLYSLKVDKDKNITENFRLKEFACKDGSDIVVLHEEFVQKIQQIRSHFNLPVTINSAYRTPEHNKREGGSSNSYHVKGRAFDIVVKGVSPNEVAKYAQTIGINGIIQYNSFTHIDSRLKKYFAIQNGGKFITVQKF